MKKKKFVLLSTVVVALLALVAVGTVLGQEPQEPDEGLPPSHPVVGDLAEFPDEVDPGSEGQVEAAGEVGPLAQPPYTMNYQGYLTDGSGNPLDGTYDLTFSLYDDATGGTREWGPETHNGVQVSNGLFHVVLGESVTLYPDDFDEALFLEVEVSGTALATRQPVRTVAYAFGLAPGAEVEGDPEGRYALSVNNTGNASNDRGLYVRGQQYGIYAEEVSGVSGVDVGIYSPDFVQARGYKSNDDSYLWMPGAGGVAYPSTWTAYPRFDGTARLEASGAGTKYFYLPVTIPGLLYGQEVRVEQLTVYYYTANSANYITNTRMEKLTGAASSDTLINDPTDRTSTTATSYSITPTGNYTLTAASGPLQVQLGVYFDGAALANSVYIGGVRLRLGHTD